MPSPQALAPDPTSEAPAAFRWIVLAGVWLLYFCYGLAVSTLAPLVEPVTRDLGISHSAMGGVFGIWQLVFVTAAVPCGGLLDRLGPARAMVIGAFLIALSCYLRAIAVDGLSLYLAVGLFGIGAPLVSTGGPKSVSLLFSGRIRGFAMGVYMTGMTSGGIVALSLTNSVLMPFWGGDWRAVLLAWTAVPTLVVLVWLGLSLHPRIRQLGRRHAAETRPPQLQVIAGLLRLPTVRVVVAMSVGMFIFGHAMHGWLPEILRANELSATAAGYWASVPTLVGMIGALVIPSLATPRRRMPVLLVLFLSMAGASLCMHAEPGAVLALGLVLLGIARSSVTTIMVLTLVETRGVGERHAGTATGLFFSAAELGGAAGPAIVGVLHDATGGFDLALHLLTGVTIALLFGLYRLSRLVPGRGPGS